MGLLRAVCGGGASRFASPTAGAEELPAGTEENRGRGPLKMVGGRASVDLVSAMAGSAGGAGLGPGRAVCPSDSGRLTSLPAAPEEYRGRGPLRTVCGNTRVGLFSLKAAPGGDATLGLVRVISRYCSGHFAPYPAFHGDNWGGGLLGTVGGSAGVGRFSLRAAPAGDGTLGLTEAVGGSGTGRLSSCTAPPEENWEGGPAGMVGGTA